MLRTRFILLIAIPLFFNTLLFGESKGVNRAKYRIGISGTTSEINIDGVLDEPIWSSTETATHFQRVLPTDTGFASAQTEVRLTYTESTIYLAVTCYDSSPGKRPVESLRRDFNFGKNDNFIVFIEDAKMIMFLLFSNREFK